MKKIKLLTFIIFIIFFLNGCNSDDKLFEKKQECLKYRESFEKDNQNLSLNEIFYSKKLNTCITVSSNEYFYYIDDLLNNKELYNFNKSNFNEKEFNNKINDLKGK